MSVGAVSGPVRLYGDVCLLGEDRGARYKIVVPGSVGYRVVLGTAGTVLYRSWNSGASWSELYCSC